MLIPKKLVWTMSIFMHIGKIKKSMKTGGWVVVTFTTHKKVNRKINLYFLTLYFMKKDIICPIFELNKVFLSVPHSRKQQLAVSSKLLYCLANLFDVNDIIQHPP
jgi:hypothetical protein